MKGVRWTVNVYDYESDYDDWRDDPRWDILTAAAMELFKPLTVDDSHSRVQACGHCDGEFTDSVLFHRSTPHLFCSRYCMESAVGSTP